MTAPAPGPRDVVAAVLRDGDGRYLLAQRPSGRHHAGRWEFPGGKREAGESAVAALARELREELGIAIDDAAPLARIAWPDPEQPIRLEAWSVARWRGEPRGLDGQALQWVSAAELDAWPMPPADRPLVTALRLPDHYAITPECGGDFTSFGERVERLFAGGVRLLQLRCKHMDPDALALLARRCAALAERHGADVLVNGAPELAERLDIGLHLTAAQLRGWIERLDGDGLLPDGAESWLAASVDGRPLALDPVARSRTPHRPRRARGWLAASCHDDAEIALAARLGCDFVTVSPVAATPSHAQAQPLGWPGLAERVAHCPMPVYALGGLSAGDVAQAQLQGARGIAGIRAFWPRRGGE